MPGSVTTTRRLSDAVRANYYKALGEKHDHYTAEVLTDLPLLLQRVDFLEALDKKARATVGREYQRAAESSERDWFGDTEHDIWGNRSR